MDPLDFYQVSVSVIGWFGKKYDDLLLKNANMRGKRWKKKKRKFSLYFGAKISFWGGRNILIWGIYTSLPGFQYSDSGLNQNRTHEGSVFFSFFSSRIQAGMYIMFLCILVVGWGKTSCFIEKNANIRGEMWKKSILGIIIYP